jgi:CubicO group peptidase (beta-lactamase class C family)
MRTLARFTGLLIFCLLPSLAWADRFDDARTLVREHMQKNNIPAMSVAVWRDGKILWEEGFGLADKENGVAADANTMFCLASLSKTMTATGLMTLVQSGRVDIDAPINQYLGQDTLTSMIGDPRQVTVRRVANHTAGLPGADQFFYGDEVANAPSMGEELRRYGILVAPAGERYRYSNIGYGALGHLISKVSGKSYDDFMLQDLFQPLGMMRSSVNLAPGLEKFQAVRYDFDRNPIPFYVSAEPGSASVYSSAHDLAKFGIFVLKNRVPGQKQILSSRSIDLLTSDAIIEGQPTGVSKDGMGYAFGWIVWEEDGYRYIGHNGSTSGVSSNFAMIPEENTGIVVLGNADGAASGVLRTAILKALLPSYHQAAPEPAKPATAATPFKPAPELVGTWKGTVRTPEGEQPMELKVLPTGDTHVRIGGEPRYPNRSTFLQEALVNRVAFKDGELTGSTMAQIQTADTKRQPHTVSLYLKLRGDRLNGSATAVSVFDGFWIFGLPHWADLQKVADGG